MRNIKKILVVDVAGIGDTVMSVPALRALRSAFPKAYIAVLVSQRAVQLLTHCPYVNQVFPFEINNFRVCAQLFNVSKTFSMLNIISTLRRRRFDAAINLYQISSNIGNLRMKMLFKAIGSNLKIGRVSDGRGDFFDLELKDSFFEMEHEVQKKLHVVELLGAHSDDAKLELWTTDEDELCVDGLLRSVGIREEDCIVGINPSSAQECKLWDNRLFAKVSDDIITRYRMKVVFCGSTHD